MINVRCQNAKVTRVGNIIALIKFSFFLYQLQLLCQSSSKGFYFVFHLLPSLSDNTCLWLDLRICERF
jgi:hypothetical protein